MFLLLLAWCSALAPPVVPRTRIRSAPIKGVETIASDADFLSAMAAGDLVLVKFYASWCRACKTIEPRYKRLANEFHDVARFYEVEFSANKDLCRRLGIKKLPCVQFYKGPDGCLDTVMCGPSKFADVKLKLKDVLGEDAADLSGVPEFTDISNHYDV